MPGLYAIANPIPATGAKHGLVLSAVAATDPTRWELGFTVCPENCVEVGLWDPDCDTWPEGEPPSKSAAPENLDCYDTDPFIVESAFECSAVGFSTQDYAGRARRQLDAASSKALEYELWTGTLKPDNAHLTAGAEVLAGGAPLDPVTALATLSQALSDCAHGGRGMIHAPTLIADAWFADSAVETDGQRIVTPNRGDIVVAGTGYPGLGPDNATPETGTMWVYATGPVQYRLGDITVYPDTLTEATDYRHNRIEYRAERFAAANFDPCCHFGVLVDVSALGGGGGGGGDGAWTTGQIEVLLANTSEGWTDEDVEAQLLFSQTLVSGRMGVASVIAVSDDTAYEGALHGWSIENTAEDVSTVYVRFGVDGSADPFIPINLAIGETVTWAFPTPLPSQDLFVTVEAGSVVGVLYITEP